MLYRRTGSVKARDILIKNHQNALYLAAMKTPANIMSMDDKMQFANILLLKLISKGGFDCRRRVKFNNFLIARVNQRIIDEIRKHGRKKGYPIGERQLKSEDNPIENYEEREVKELLVTNIQRLPRDEQVIMACLLNGMSQTEIAEQSGVSKSRISQIVNEARRKLKYSMSVA